MKTRVAEDVSRAPAAPVRPARRRGRWRNVAILGGLGLVSILGLVGYGAHEELEQSLPVVDGVVIVSSLGGPVTVERDGIGVPTLRAGDRRDAVRALGFVHAQDRFFQMDLLRRESAGELAALLGEDALERDRETRVHRLRRVARASWNRSTGRERSLVAAYTEGVNAGLVALEEPPPEYLLMGVEPEQWSPVDSYLVLLSLFLQLQDEAGSREASLGVLYDAFPEELANFLAPVGTDWDAPLLGEATEPPPLPGPAVYDIRARRDAASLTGPSPRHLGTWRESPVARGAASNGWAVGGGFTAHGGAMLANDMHLPLRVPNIWYRVRVIRPSDRGGSERNVVGVSLPGLPLVVIGSNRRVAWGLTNAWTDASDLVVVDAGPTVNQYMTPSGPKVFGRARESIVVRDGPTSELEVKSTIWGPVIGEDHRGRELAMRWVAYDPEAVDLEFLAIEEAESAAEAIELATRSGGPQLNLVVADAEGSIGWTMTGKVPRRSGFSGRLPRSWSDGRVRWAGWLAPEEVPRILDPPSGRIWTANNRVVGGDEMSRLGDGGYLLGARAKQIRDGLFARETFDERAMLDLQLDDRARFYARWRELFLVVASQAAPEGSRRAEARALVERWGGRASVDSVGFRLVRAFRLLVEQRVREMLTSPCRELEPEFGRAWTSQFEGPLWVLVTSKPEHLLDSGYDSWEELLDEQMDATLAFFESLGGDLADHPWGEANTVEMRHVLSGGLPWLRRWLDMPARPLPGAEHMPRFQTLDSGASQRMVVAPGHEEDGIFHMPGGQSGHPLSPHYGDSHGSWADGTAQSLVPGAPVSTLILRPTDGGSIAMTSEEIR